MSKKKRCATGYNRYIQSCAKETGDLKGCSMDKGWSKLSDNEKNSWKELAKEQCDV